MAQDQPIVQNYGPEDYSAASQNWSIDVTEMGIVAGNSEGVLEFDGEHWTIYSIPGKHKVRAVLNRNDTIFCGGFGEFGYWTRQTDGTRAYHSLSKRIDHPLASVEEIWHIAEYPGGILFQSFSTLYLYQQGEIRVLTPPFSTGIMFAYWCQHEFLFQVLGKGIARLDPYSETIALISTEGYLRNGTIIGMVDVEDGVLIGTEGGRFFLYDGVRIRPALQNLSEVLRENELNKLVASSEYLFVGSILDGVFVVSHDGAIQEHIDHASGLRDNTVLALRISESGTCWIGLDDGISCFHPGSDYRRYQDTEGDLGVVYSAIEYQGDLYLGSNRGLFRRQSISDQGFELITGTQGQVWSLELIDGQLFCGHNDGTFIIGDGEIQKVSDVTGAWSWLLLEEDHRWLQGTYTGLVCVEPGSRGKMAFRKIEGLNSPIRNLVQDKDGAIWGVAPNRGIYRIRLNDPLDSVVALEQNLESWRLPDLNRLFLSKIGAEIVVRSDSGWYRWTGQDFEPATAVRGVLLDQSILSIHEVGDYFIVVRADKLEILKGASQNLVPVGHLPESPCFYQLSNNKLLCGISQGYVVFSTEHSVWNEPGPLTLTAIQVYGDERWVPYPLTPPQDSTAGIHLSSEQTGLFLRYSSGFTGRKDLYRYRLASGKNWTNWSQDASLTLQLLPLGENNIIIQRQSDMSQIMVMCYREYPWYLKSWAIGLMVLLVIGSVFIGLRKYQQALERTWKKRQIEIERARHAQEVERRNKELMEDLEEQNQELAGITMNLVSKNETILDMRNELKKLQRKKELSPQMLRTMVLKLNTTLSSEKDWEAFEYHFTRVHQGFFKGLKQDYPSLTPGDMRLAAYLRMNLSSKEIAPLLHISVRSVENKRYRLRRKLDLNPNQQIIDILLTY